MFQCKIFFLSIKNGLLKTQVKAVFENEWSEIIIIIWNTPQRWWTQTNTCVVQHPARSLWLSDKEVGHYK